MKKQFILTTVLSSLIGVIMFYSEKAKAGAVAGRGLCENVIIPSLLPVLILTNVIISSDCRVVIEKIFGRLFGRIFNVSPACTVAVLLGLIAGYPAGALLTERLYSSGIIDKSTACRVMKYNFSGGLAFTVMVVGRTCYGSSRVGILLYLSNLFSSIIIGVVSGIGSKDICCNSAGLSGISFTDSMSEAVEVSIKSILNMCAYIILFSAVNGIFTLPDYINPLLEITNGVCCAMPRIRLDYCAFFLGFGGLCIHLQLVGIFNKFNMSYVSFLISRLAGAIISFFTVKTICFLFPQYTSVFSAGNAPLGIQLTQVNTGLSVIMILGCAVLILDIEGRKLKLI